MTDYAALKKKVDELAERVWDEAGIKARINKMVKEGIPRKNLEPEYWLSHKEEILDRVQLRGEEYNYTFKNCAQGTAMALLEEFGLGNMDIIKALSPFPGIGGTGDTTDFYAKHLRPQNLRLSTTGKYTFRGPRLRSPSSCWIPPVDDESGALRFTLRADRPSA